MLSTNFKVEEPRLNSAQRQFQRGPTRITTDLTTLKCRSEAAISLLHMSSILCRACEVCANKIMSQLFVFAHMQPTRHRLTSPSDIRKQNKAFVDIRLCPVRCCPWWVSLSICHFLLTSTLVHASRPKIRVSIRVDPWRNCNVGSAGCLRLQSLLFPLNATPCAPPFPLLHGACCYTLRIIVL